MPAIFFVLFFHAEGASMPLNVVRSKGIRKAAPAAPPQLNYHGGPLLANPEVTTIYWGSAWGSDPLRPEMDAFFDFIVTSSLLAQLAEYNVPGFTIGKGKHVQSVTISSDPANPLDDSQIQSMLNSLIADGTVGRPNANSIYFFFLPSGVTVTLQGEASCQQFCGYHNLSSSGVVYAVDTYDDCQGCQFVSGDTLASSTVVASHEFCESVTDPQLNAWFDDNTGEEIGDICEGQNKTINTASTLAAGSAPLFNVSISPAQVSIDGTSDVRFQVTLSPAPGASPTPPTPTPSQSYVVQKEWSNAQGACI